MKRWTSGAESAENDGKYIDLTLNDDYIKKSLGPAEIEYCEKWNAPTPLAVTTQRENQSTIYEGYLNLMPAEDPTSISRSKTQIEDYLIQAVPEMVLSADQTEYDDKFTEIQAQLKSLGYDEVTAYYSDAWQKAIAEYNTLMGK